jgi:drug/metabolite transporter (DMT)-like permease
MQRSYATTILQALLVTFLWSTSFILIKWGLQDLPPVTFASLRYLLASLLLLPFLLRRGGAAELRTLTGRDWLNLAALGLVYYTLTQGAQFLALSLMPANTLSLLLSLSSVSIALLGLWLLAERLGGTHWLGIALALAGALIYFGSFGELPAPVWAVGALAVFSNSFAAVMGRSVNRRQDLSPLLVTVVSMGIGSLLLLAWGLATEPFPSLGLREWILVFWLASVNTALAFTLWNHTLRTLSAAQSSVINNTMLIQIAILAWLFLGERLTPVEITGLLVAALGTLLVQLRRSSKEHAGIG